MMENNNIRYKVIWIDDECETNYDLITFAAGRGIDIKAFKYGEYGIRELENNIGTYVGVILDVVCFYNEDDEKGRGAEGRNYFRVWTELRDVMAQKNTQIPLFVYSAQPGYYENDVFIDSVERHKIYSKEDDVSPLLDDIKAEAEKLPQTIIRRKYLSFIRDNRFQDIESELITILTAVENNETNNGSVIPQCRFVLSWVMKYLGTVGMLPQNFFNGTNLSECSRLLGNPKMGNFVPFYIQRNLHSCVVVTNEGSHRSVVFNAIESGDAPFLIRSTVFELLNILTWCANLSTKQEDVDSRQAVIRELKVNGKPKKDENDNGGEDNTGEETFDSKIEKV